MHGTSATCQLRCPWLLGCQHADEAPETETTCLTAALAELLVAARAANEGLQEKLSRSGRQAEAVKPLQGRLRSLQEELVKARAEAEELREGLAAEKKKVGV